jgi:hypothetical protein
VAAALGEVPGAKVQGKVAKGTGKDEISPVTVDLDTAKADVGDLAKAAADAQTPHRGEVGAPSAYLVVEASGLTEDNAKKLQGALKDVKGVEPKTTNADVKKKEIHVKLDDKGGAKLADIKKALADYTK